MTSVRTEGAPAAPQEIEDQELDVWILTRLRMLGVDLSVLPEDDPDAPADRRRILASARRFLRRTPPAIVDFGLDPQDAAPAFYPASIGGKPAPPRPAEGEGSRG